jgi:uncharacterized membrane protein YkgB
VKLGSKLAFLEYKATCYDPDIKRILDVSVETPDSLNEWERRYLEDVDQCIRFLYICTLHAGTKIPPKGSWSWKQFFFPWRLVPKAYYFYLDKLVDEKKQRPELHKYVAKYFPLLNDWLLRNQVALKSYVTHFDDGALQAKSVLTKIAAVVADRNIPFLVCSIGMIVMLLWAGRFKMTAPGAEGIIPLVSNSPLTSLQFKALGPYILGDMIGATEWTAAILLILGYFKPKAGILGGMILVVMFFTTSTMLITTPDDTIVVHGIHYMNNLGLFLFKDIISFGVAFYLISYYGRRAILAENQR